MLRPERGRRHLILHLVRLLGSYPRFVQKFDRESWGSKIGREFRLKVLTVGDEKEIYTFLQCLSNLTLQLLRRKNWIENIAVGREGFVREGKAI